MNIKYTKKSFFLALLCLLVSSAAAQSINVGNVDAGPYGPGSTITIPIKLSNTSGCFAAKKNNTFGLTAFTSYGFFWLSLVGLIVMPKLGWGAAPSEGAMCAYLSVWGVFTLLLFFGTLKLNRALQFVFASLTILFFLLVVGDATGNNSIKHLAGYEGIICGASAIYTGIANVLNEMYGKVVLSVGPVNV